MKIAVAGTGYVGMSNAVLLAQHNEVIAIDIDRDRVEKINNKKSTVADRDIDKFLVEKDLNLKATLDKRIAYENTDFVIVATPTDYDPETNYFNTKSIESVISDVIEVNDKATIVIKSTIPVGYTNQVREKFGTRNIIFSPEFLREGQALHDNLNPSRIIVGEKSDRAVMFAGLLERGAAKKNISILYTDSTEAEAIKLFSNAYLAMRVAYFNELDSYAEKYGLDSKDIIEGVCLDPRIGMHYNNPSFGYGGYCFPKDTKQLKANFIEVDNNLISAIVDSNETRKSIIAKNIIKLKPEVVGIYRLIMKAGSDNYRSSAIQNIIEKLLIEGIKVVVYEPTLKETSFEGLEVINNLKDFKNISSVVVANRIEDNIRDISEKVYTRDIFNEDK
nr:putative dehydrogenase [Vibrio metoecus]